MLNARAPSSLHLPIRNPQSSIRNRQSSVPISVSINVSTAAAAALQSLRGGLADRARLHARIAGSAEKLVKRYGRETTAGQHATATRLGARPTRHLEKAYRSIEAKSDSAGAFLLVPRASRLRAAFGDYVVAPGSGKKYLTIPAAAEAYGKRAGEFKDLVFMRVGPRLTPVLARPVKTGEGLQIMYFLTKRSLIKADRGLLPFDLLGPDASAVAIQYVEQITRAAARQP